MEEGIEGPFEETPSTMPQASTSLCRAIERKETTMTLNSQRKDASPATTPGRIGHWVRVVVMFLSFGFIFPHAMTEDDKGR